MNLEEADQTERNQF